MSAENVIVYSSNIGIAQLAQRLDGVDFVEGLKDFGFTEKTGIDLPYEHTGIMPHITQMESEIYKATVGYGYGMRATLMQLVRAYNVFNNRGRLVEPKIVADIVDPMGRHYDVPYENEPRQVLPPATAYKMQRILEKVVAKGTGTKAQVPGLQIGGKTGTAHIPPKNGATPGSTTAPSSASPTTRAAATPSACWCARPKSPTTTSPPCPRYRSSERWWS
jgi:cell division protein FtsI (penicillin-binding protein 3)